MSSNKLWGRYINDSCGEGRWHVGFKRFLVQFSTFNCSTGNHLKIPTLQVIDFSSQYAFHVVHTPGHTPESVVYLLIDKTKENKPLKVLCTLRATCCTGQVFYFGAINLCFFFKTKRDLTIGICACNI